MDIEAPHRQQIISAFFNWCDVAEEVAVTGRDGRGRVDVLAWPRQENLRDMTIAFEVKLAKENGQRPDMGAWIKQCSDYVGSKPDFDCPAIAAVFMWDAEKHYSSSREDRYQMEAYGQVAAQFRVGFAGFDDKRGAYLRFSGGCLFLAGNGGWFPRAETLLRCKRKVMGVRRN